jgi:tetratricopeptide (TPR) repeat protein
MGASWLVGYEQALGASGMVFGLIGAVLWLEWRRPADVPAPWRFPRRVLLVALIGENLMMLFVPGIAHAAHGGGLVAGALATALVAGPSLAGARPRWLLAGDAGLAAALVVSGVAAAWAALPGADALLERHAARLLQRDDLSPAVLNDQAWLIAVSESPSPAQIEVARRLAERAVRATERQDPNILDTLAEVYFVAGRLEEAVATIDEAIALAPGESYFREQRRRFTGERAPEDRPAPPGPWPDFGPGPWPGLPREREPRLPDREPEVPDSPSGLHV